MTDLIATIFTQLRPPTASRTAAPDPCWCATPDEAYATCQQQLAIYQQWHQAGLIQLQRPQIGEGRGRGPAGHEARSNVPRVILMLEGAGGVRHLDDLRSFHAAGVRLISLPFWSQASRWAGGNRSGGDLTPAGRALAAEIDYLGMIHDVSHLSEQSFWSLLDCSGPGAGKICATHSNCRALLAGKEHDERHLTDAQINALLNRGGKEGGGGGIIGINLYSAFLVTGRRAKISDVVVHLQHICQIAGRADGIALGSDMDGGLSALDLPENLDHPRHLHRLAEALADAGFTDSQIAGFQSGNWRRFLGTSTNGTDLPIIDFQNL